MDDLKDDFVKPLVYRKTYNMFVRPNTSYDLVCDEAQDYKNLFIDPIQPDIIASFHLSSKPSYCHGKILKVSTPE